MDLSVGLGPVELPSPILAASGTFGVGDEVARICDPTTLGAVTAKSQAAFAWPGNPPPRLAGLGAGMINAVGLQGDGVDVWVAHHLPALRARGARVIASIWGRSVAEFADAAARVAPVREQLIALELNLSCPNVEHHSAMFAHDPVATAEVVTAAKSAVNDLPVFAKLSPNVADVVPVARAATDAGATALTLVNTVLGFAIDAETRAPVLARGVGGYSGPPIKPIALRVVHEVHEALPEVPIIGTGGVNKGVDAVEMLLAGATAVGVGTATFAEPRACLRVLAELTQWCEHRGITRVSELRGALRGPP